MADASISAAGTVTVLELPTLTLVQLPPATMINLRGEAQDRAFLERASEVLGLAVPIVPNSFASASGRCCLWQGPDEWLIVEPEDEASDLCATLDNALAELHHAVTDVSGNRTRLRLSGPGAAGLLNGGCSLDFGSGAVLPGTLTQTLLARVPVTILCVDAAPTFDLFTRRSLTRYVQDWFSAAAGDDVPGSRYDG